MRGTRFNDINDITVQVFQHRVYQMHKKRLEKIGNGQFLNSSVVVNQVGPSLANMRSSQQRQSLNNKNNNINNNNNNCSPTREIINNGPGESILPSPRGQNGGRYSSMEGGNGAGGNVVLNQSKLGLGGDSARARNAVSVLEQKYLSTRMQTIEHRENQKLREIKHENEILLNKLISIQKGNQLSVPPHLLNSSSRLLINSNSNFNNLTLSPTPNLDSTSPRFPNNIHNGMNLTQSNKKLRTLNMVQKKLEAQRIDQANIFLLNKITQIQPSIDKRKIEHDWNQQKMYRQMIQRAARKADLNELLHKRQDFLEKNFATLPKINHRDSSLESLENFNNEFTGDTFVQHQNPQAAQTLNIVELQRKEVLPSPRMAQTKIQKKKKPNYLRLSHGQISNSELENLKTSNTVQNSVISNFNVERKSLQYESSPINYSLNLNAVSALNTYKSKPQVKNLILHSKKKFHDSSALDLQNLNSARSIVPPEEKLVQEEKMLENLIKEAESYGIKTSKTMAIGSLSDRRIDETGFKNNEDTSASLSNILPNDIQVLPIPNKLKQRTVLNSPEHSPQGTQQMTMNKSSNSTLMLLNNNASATGVTPLISGQQTLTKVSSNNIRYQQSSPRQHATIKKITAKMLPSMSRSRFNYQINKNSNKQALSPSNQLNQDTENLRGDSILSTSSPGVNIKTDRAETQLQMLGDIKGGFLEQIQVRETLNKSALDQKQYHNFKKEFKMPSSNILAELHLGQRKQKKKIPFNLAKINPIKQRDLNQTHGNVQTSAGLEENSKMVQRSFDMRAAGQQYPTVQEEMEQSFVMTPQIAQNDRSSKNKQL